MTRFSSQTLAAGTMVCAGASFALVNTALQGATMLHGAAGPAVTFWQYFIALLFYLPWLLRHRGAARSQTGLGLHLLRVGLAVGGVQLWTLGLGTCADLAGHCSDPAVTVFCHTRRGFGAARDRVSHPLGHCCPRPFGRRDPARSVVRSLYAGSSPSGWGGRALGQQLIGYQTSDPYRQHRNSDILPAAAAVTIERDRCANHAGRGRNGFDARQLCAAGTCGLAGVGSWIAHRFSSAPFDAGL